VNLDADDVLGEARQAGGHETAAGADLEDRLVRLDFECLQHARLDLRAHHDLAAVQRNVDVGKCQLAVAHRDEIFALYRLQQFEHPAVEDLPGANLLFHHVESGLFEVHFPILAPGPGTSVADRQA
jgi:hypothetical protein